MRPERNTKVSEQMRKGRARQTFQSYIVLRMTQIVN